MGCQELGQVLLHFGVAEERHKVGRTLGGRICAVLEKHVDEFPLSGPARKLETSLVRGGFDVWICMLL